MPRATGVRTQIARYEEAWEAINRLIRRGGSWSGRERSCFYVQNGRGEFENVSAVFGVDTPEDGRGLAVLDPDGDGDLDLVVKSRSSPQLRLWRNEAPQGARIEVTLVGSPRNPQAIGGRVRARAGRLLRTKEVTAGCGFLCQGSARLFLGLGAATRVDSLEVRWPGGAVDSFEGLDVNRSYRIAQGAGIVAARPLEPPQQRGAQARGGAAGREGGGAPPSRDGTEVGGGPEETAGTLAVPVAAEGLSGPAAERGGLWLLAPARLPPLDLRDAQGLPAHLGGGPTLVSFLLEDCPRCATESLQWARERARAVPASFRHVALSPGPIAGLGPVTAAAEALGPGGPERLGIDDRSLLGLGLLLEEIADWPREVPAPSSILLDVDGRIVKLYRGAVSLETVTADVASIPATPARRLELGLPFPGVYHATEVARSEFQLGVSYLEAGLDDHALAAFRAALERHPGQADAWYNIGVLLHRKGLRDEAGVAYEQALRLDPRFMDARSNRAVILAEAGRHEEAAAAFRAIVADRPDHAEAWINLGSVALRLGNVEEAFSALRKAEELEPGLAHVQKKLGDAHRAVGDLEGARRAYERAARLAPRDAEAWSNLAAVEAQSGSLEASLLSARRAVEADPKFPSGHNNLGLILQGLGRVDEAVAAFEQAVALAPELAPAWLNLARARLRQGDRGAAEAALKELLKRSPDQPAALALLRELRGE